MRCRHNDCRRWIISTKKNSLACDNCYEQFWRDQRGGAEKKAEKMFNLRNPDAKRRKEYKKRK